MTRVVLQGGIRHAFIALQATRHSNFYGKENPSRLQHTSLPPRLYRICHPDINNNKNSVRIKPTREGCLGYTSVFLVLHILSWVWYIWSYGTPTTTSPLDGTPPVVLKSPQNSNPLAPIWSTCLGSTAVTSHPAPFFPVVPSPYYWVKLTPTPSASSAVSEVTRLFCNSTSHQDHSYGSMPPTLSQQEIKP